MSEDGGWIVPNALAEKLWHLNSQGNPFREELTPERRAELDRWWRAYNRPHRRLLRWVTGGWRETLHDRLYPECRGYDDD